MLKKTVDFRNGAIESNDSEAVVRDVQYQVLAHNGQTHEAEITTGIDPRRSADIDAGETGAIVSPLIPSDKSCNFPVFIHSSSERGRVKAPCIPTRLHDGGVNGLGFRDG